VRRQPEFPIYIVSKGRWKVRYTSCVLEALKVPYRIIVEEQERDEYAAVIDPRKILVLDKAFQKNYETLDDRSLGTGSGPARNFAWEHAISEGHPWHWTVDDNISAFYWLNKNVFGKVEDGTIFRCMEDFVQRYENVAMAGPNYFMFASRKAKMPPFYLNTRIYSCNLIRSDAPYRWRCRWNEDTDLSLRMLKDGWCTILFNAFLQLKHTTQRVKGGNTEDYKKAGTFVKSQMLADAHPDVTEVVRRWGRVHHYVDYRPFRNNKLVLKSGLKIRRVNDYGMKMEPILRK
jgi:hypothetical protein